MRICSKGRKCQGRKCQGRLGEYMQERVWGRIGIKMAIGDIGKSEQAEPTSASWFLD